MRSKINEPLLHDETPLDNNEKYLNFINMYVPKFQEIISDTVKKVDATKYDDQQKYLQDIFERSGDKCWDYMQKIIVEAKEKPDADIEMLNSINEEGIKDTVTLTATGMFIQMAFESLTEED